MRMCGADDSGGRRVLAAIGTLAMLVPGALPPTAAAQPLTVDKRCYVNAADKPAPMTVGGTGFVPGDAVLISSSDGSVDTRTTADASGDILIHTDAPTPTIKLPGPKTVMLTAQDLAAAVPISVTVPVTTTTRDVLPQPTRAKLTSKVTWYFAGFTPGKLVYGHYVRKHQVTLARFGRAHGPCGLLKARARFYPGAHPRFNQYTLQFDASRHYFKNSVPRVVLQITRTLR